MSMRIDGDTIAVIKHTWLIITGAPETRQLMGERLMLNYLRAVPSARYFFPIISDDEMAEKGLYLISCIDKVIKLLENQNDPRLKALLRSYGIILLRYRISPSYYTTAWSALIETLQDTLKDGFSGLMLAYWVDIIEPVNSMMTR